MTDPFAAIDTFLERWRASLAPPFTLAYVDGFIRRHRAQVETLIADTLAHRRARGGERPAYKPDFLAYDALTTAQRRLDAQTDKEVMAQLLRRVDDQFVGGYSERSVIHTSPSNTPTLAPRPSSCVMRAGTPCRCSWSARRWSSLPAGTWWPCATGGAGSPSTPIARAR